MKHVRVLVFQHHDSEGPGTLGTFLREDGGLTADADFVHFVETRTRCGSGARREDVS